MVANITPAHSCLKAELKEHFGFKKKESNFLDKTLALCNLFHTNVKYSGNTTNLRAHLKCHHPDKVTLSEEPTKIRPDPKQTMLYSDGKCFHKFPSTSARLQKITETTSYFICQDLRPNSVVEKSGFRPMVNVMEPRYQIPTHEHLTKVCNSQAVCPGRDTRQSLTCHHRVGCPDVRWVNFANNRSLCDHHRSLYQ